MATLYELVGEFRELYDMADDPDMEEQFDTWLDTIEGVEGEIEAKAEGYVKLIKSLQNDVAGLKKEEERIKFRRQTIENRIDHMKTRLKEALEFTGHTKFRTPSDLFTIYVKKNPPSLKIDDESKIPAGYWIPQQPKLDTQSLKEAVSKMEEAPEYAHLESGTSIAWR